MLGADHVCLSLQGPPGQPGYPGAMGPPGLPVSKGTLARGYWALGWRSGRDRARPSLSRLLRFQAFRPKPLPVVHAQPLLEPPSQCVSPLRFGGHCRHCTSGARRSEYPERPSPTSASWAGGWRKLGAAWRCRPTQEPAGWACPPGGPRGPPLPSPHVCVAAAVSTPHIVAVTSRPRG